MKKEDEDGKKLCVLRRERVDDKGSDEKERKETKEKG